MMIPVPSQRSQGLSPCLPVSLSTCLPVPLQSGQGVLAGAWRAGLRIIIGGVVPMCSAEQK